jgi:hypothetical protein
VTTIEFHAELAARATVSFAQTPHIRAAHGDGTRVMFEPADVEPPPYSRRRRPGATRARGCRGAAERLTILADPNAAGFYERNGAVRIGEAPSDAVPGHLLRDIRFYAAVKSRPARDSLIRRKNSLMARINPLQGRIKFPVPMLRELGCKPLNSAIDFEPIVALGGLDEQNSGIM